MTKEKVPQIVLLTFDDALNDLNWKLYQDIFYAGRTNPNGCPILGTFYVSHEWTDYGKVQTMYANGHEMASHSIRYVIPNFYNNYLCILLQLSYCNLYYIES